MKRTTQTIPQWKRDLMTKFRDFLATEAKWQHPALWAPVLREFTEDDVLAIVGQAYAINGWKKRMAAALAEREEAIIECLKHAPVEEPEPVSWLPQPPGTLLPKDHPSISHFTPWPKDGTDTGHLPAKEDE